VTACTSARRELLTNDTIHQAFRRFAQDGPEFGAWIGACILMPDHFHLFVVLDDRQRLLSDWIKSLKGTLSLTLRDCGNQAPYWQKAFSITPSADLNRTQPNGITSEKMLFAEVWSGTGNNGLTPAKYIRWITAASPFP